jgi:hypothetical protein
MGSSNWDNWKKQKRPFYHPNFDRRSLSRKQRVKFTCERCGAKQGEERLNRRGCPSKVMVSAAHINHDPWNSRAKLIILCQACHNRHDRYDRADKARKTHYRKRHESMIQAGQLELFTDKGRKYKRLD